MSHQCYHCGNDCGNAGPSTDGLLFCCDGCSFVYSLLKENNLCDYYSFDKMPGIQAKGKFDEGRFGYLDNEEVVRKLTKFSDGKQLHVLFSIPQMHCASCIWLLENLHRANSAVIKSTVDFGRKEALIVFEPEKLSLRKLVELMAYVGYEPYISLQDVEHKGKSEPDRSRIYKLGVAGFCFGNIMMLSLPEYLSHSKLETGLLHDVFFYLNLIFSFSPSLIYVICIKSTADSHHKKKRMQLVILW